jgi:hypothetical protein
MEKTFDEGVSEGQRFFENNRVHLFGWGVV